MVLNIPIQSKAETLQSKSQPALKCDLMEATSEKDCVERKRLADGFFQDKKMLERIQKCENYFDSIDTLAFEKVKYNVFGDICASFLSFLNQILVANRR